MSGKNGSDFFDAMNQSFGELSPLQAGFHGFNNASPELFSAFRVDPNIADDRELMRNGSDINQDCVPRRCVSQLQFPETVTSAF